MRNSMKLLSISALALALGGCSLAGTGDYHADQYGPMQAAQNPQYWGAGQPDCQQAPVQAPAQLSNPCDVSYPVAPQHVQPYNYGAQAAAPAPQAYAPAVPQYQGQVAQGQFAQGQVLQGQFPQGQVLQGQAYQLPQNYAGYQGQPVYTQGGFPGGYAPVGYAPAYVGAQGGSAKSLRPSYAYGTLGGILYDVDSDLYGLQARAGYQSSYFIGAEIEGSFGVNNDDATVLFGGTPLPADIGIDTQIAGYGVLRYPVTSKFDVFGRVGYHNTEFGGDVTDGVTVADVDFNTDGIAYGGGIEYAITPLFGVRADYTRYDFDGPDADSVSVAVTRKF